MTIAESLKRFRTTKKLSQRQLAEKIGVPYQSYQTYEYGSSTPTAGVIIKIAQAFDVSTDYLLGLRDTPKPNEVSTEKTKKALALLDTLRACLNE